MNCRQTTKGVTKQQSADGTRTGAAKRQSTSPNPHRAFVVEGQQHVDHAHAADVADDCAREHSVVMRRVRSAAYADGLVRCGREVPVGLEQDASHI